MRGRRDMTKITSVLLLAAALGLAAPSAVSAQQGPDSSGRVGAERAAPMALTISPATACLQLHLGTRCSTSI